MSQSLVNLFESTKLTDDSLTSLTGEPCTTEMLDETRIKIKSNGDYLSESISGTDSLNTVKVYLRFKPKTSKYERAKKQEELDYYIVVDSKTLITKLIDSETISSRKAKPNEATSKKFIFTKIFKVSSTQLRVFKECAAPSIHRFLTGENSTFISYGTKNSGKTFTFFGNEKSPGIIPQTIQFIYSNVVCTLSPLYKPVNGFEIISIDEDQVSREIELKGKLLSTLGDRQATIDSWTPLLKNNSQFEQNENEIYSIWISFAEIYNENIHDLLGEIDEEKNSPLKLITDKQGRAFVPGLTMICPKSGLEAYQSMLSGRSRLSSRSHTIFTIYLLKYLTNDPSHEVVISTMTFSDLAGPGKIHNIQTAGESAKEIKSIKTGLLALGRCVNSVLECQSTKSNAEVLAPFRESKLTRLLQRPLSGKESMAIVASIIPLPDLHAENQSVLNFCSIAKNILIIPSKELLKISMLKHQFFSSIDGKESEESIEQSVDKYESLKNTNEVLKNEIKQLKSSTLTREFEIREEMATLYSGMMEKSELNWKKRTKEIEEDQENILKWSVNQVETYYKGRLDNIKNRKRKRTNCGDYDDCEESLSRELQSENLKILSKLVTTEETLKNVKLDRDEIRQEKNTIAFKLALATEALKDIQTILKLEQGEDDFPDYKTLVNQLSSLLSEKNLKIKYYKDCLDELKKSEDSLLIIENEKSISTNIFSSYDSQRISSSTRKSFDISEKDESMQAIDASSPVDPNNLIQNRLEKLIFEHTKLKSDHLHESIRVCELSDELKSLHSIMENLKKKTLKNEKKMQEYQQKLAGRDADVNAFHTCKIKLEETLKNLCLDLKRVRVKCDAESMQKIQRLEKNFENEMAEKVIEFQDNEVLQSSSCDLIAFSKSNDRDGQSSLECRLKLLSSGVQDRENEIKSPRKNLTDIYGQNTTVVSSEYTNELNVNIGNAVTRLQEIKNNEIELLKIENLETHETNNLSRQADDPIIQLKNMKLKLSSKEEEFLRLKKNKDCTVRRFESKIRKLQRDADKNSRELMKIKRKLYPKQESCSKASLRTDGSSDGGTGDSQFSEVGSRFLVKSKSSSRQSSSQNFASLTSSDDSSSSKISHSADNLNLKKKSDRKIEITILSSESELLSDSDYKEAPNWRKISGKKN